MNPRLLLIALLALIVSGCGKQSKNRIEEKFEKYITFNGINDIVSVDSIARIDSISISYILYDIEYKADSVECRLEDILFSLPTSDYIKTENDAVQAAKLLTKWYNLSYGDKRDKIDNLKTHISTLLIDCDSTRQFHVLDKIFTSTKMGKREFYARTIGYQDTIVIAQNENDAWTEKANLLRTLMGDYMGEKYISYCMLLDDLETFINR